MRKIYSLHTFSTTGYLLYDSKIYSFKKILFVHQLKQIILIKYCYKQIIKNQHIKILKLING